MYSHCDKMHHLIIILIVTALEVNYIMVNASYAFGTYKIFVTLVPLAFLFNTTVVYSCFTYSPALLSVCIFYDSTFVQSFFILPVAAAVADINKKVADGDSQNTLQALQTPGAGLRAVLPECAETYQAELAQRQANCSSQGK